LPSPKILLPDAATLSLIGGPECHYWKLYPDCAPRYTIGPFTSLTVERKNVIK